MAVQRTSRSSIGPWTVGFVAFAGFLMMLGGLFQVFQGLAAILNKNFFVVGPNYVYNINVTTWGWIHLLLGVIIGLAGIYVYSGKGWARVMGILLAIMSAVANFFFIPYYPFWSLLIIALDISIIWALASYGPEEAASLE